MLGHKKVFVVLGLQTKTNTGMEEHNKLSKFIIFTMLSKLRILIGFLNKNEAISNFYKIADTTQKFPSHATLPPILRGGIG